MRRILRGTSGSAALVFHVFVQDSSSSTGAGKASLAFSDFSCRYIRSGETISGAITPQDITTLGTYAAPTANTNIRIKAVDNTNMIGVYEVQIHSDWVNTTNSCQSLTIFLSATGAAPLVLQIPLVAINDQDSVRFGLTALPNAAAEASGGLYTRGTGAGQINQSGNGKVDVNLVSCGSSAIDSAAFATDSITSTALASSAVTEIQTGLSTLDAAGVRTAIGLASANLDTQLGTLATASNLSTVSTNVSAIKAKTDNLPASPAATGDCITAAGVRAAVGLASANLDTQLDALPTAAENADKLIGRSVEGSADGGHTVGEAFGFLRNKWTVSGSTLTVYRTDGSTTWWTGTVSTNASADPIVGNTPS